MAQNKTLNPYKIKTPQNRAVPSADGGEPTTELVAEVMIYGPVGEGFWFEDTVSARDFVRELNDLVADRLVVRVNSEGGSVPDGVAIYNALRRHSATVDIEIDGMALSIASLIAMAGDNIRMAANAMMMLHAPWALCVGNSTDMRKYADLLDKWSEAMDSSYARVVGQDHEEAVRAALTDGEDHWYTASEAQALGLIHEITGGVAIAASYDMRHLNAALIPAAAAAHIRKEPVMPKPSNGGDSNTPQNQNNAAAEEAARQAREEFKAAEKERQSSIRQAFSPFAGYTGVSELQNECLENIDITASVAQDKLLAKLGEGAEPLGAGAQRQTAIEMGEDAVEKSRGARTQALLAKAAAKLPNEAGQVVRAQVDRSNPFRGQSLIEIARGCLDEAGVRTQGMSNEEVAQKALGHHVMAAGGQTTSDFPVIMEDTINRIMVAAYNAAPAVWDQFCKTGSVSDFKEYRRLVPSLLGGLDVKPESGEYKQKNIPDAEGEKISAEEYGNIMTVSRKVLINDDMGYIVDMANSIGMSGKRGVDTAVFKLLASNPKMRDGNALFSSAHQNLAAASAVSAASLLELADMIADQRLGAEKEPLDLVAQIALARRVIARRIKTINGAPFDTDVEGKFEVPNEAQGVFETIVSTQRVQGNGYYAFADKDIAPAIEVVFLNGQTEPVLVQHEEFRTGSLSWRAQLDYGVGAIDWRGTAKNPGK